MPDAPSIVEVVGDTTPRGFTLTYRDLACREVNAASVNVYIIRYSREGADPRVEVARTNPYTITDNSFISLVGYKFQIAASNSLAQGPYSAPVEAAILEGLFQVYYETTCMCYSIVRPHMLP